MEFSEIDKIVDITDPGDGLIFSLIKKAEEELKKFLYNRNNEIVDNVTKEIKRQKGENKKYKPTKKQQDVLDWGK